jgi:UDP-N-acetyl-D-glucosamine dehydrogenase
MRISVAYDYSHSARHARRDAAQFGEECLGLLERLQGKVDTRIVVIGIGYVGAPLAVSLADVGFSVIGVDTNQEVVDTLSSGTSTIEGVSNDHLAGLFSSGRLRFVAASQNQPREAVIQALAGSDVFITCVPTPLRQDHASSPDVTYIRQAVALIKAVYEWERQRDTLPPERLIVLESTTYPGTTREEFVTPLSAYSSSAMTTYVAYAPERVNPGDDLTRDGDCSRVGLDLQVRKVPRIIGGVDDQSAKVASALYAGVTGDSALVRKVSSLEAAEMTKLVENSYRFVAIAYANEVSRIARNLNLNVWEILDAARTKTFGWELCNPGLIGGHCIPIDPHYMTWKAREFERVMTFIDVCERSHQTLRREAIDLIQQLLGRFGRPIFGSRILLCGVAYKENVPDIRESGGLAVAKLLMSLGGIVELWDPVRNDTSGQRPIEIRLTEAERRKLPVDVAGTVERDARGCFIRPIEHTKAFIETWPELRARLTKQDDLHCVVICVAHRAFEPIYEELLTGSLTSVLVADLRNAIGYWIDPQPKKGTPAGRGRPELMQPWRQRRTEQSLLILGVD